MFLKAHFLKGHTDHQDCEGIIDTCFLQFFLVAKSPPLHPSSKNMMIRSVGEELTRVSDLLDGTKTDVISFFDEVGL